MKNNKWTFTFLKNAEEWHGKDFYDTREEAIDAAKKWLEDNIHRYVEDEYFVGDVSVDSIDGFKVGQLKRFEPRFDYYSFLSNAEYEMYESGEVYDAFNFWDPSTRAGISNLEKHVTAAISRAISDLGGMVPSNYIIDNVEFIVVN